MTAWSELTWPLSRLDEGLVRLARRARLAPLAADIAPPPPGLAPGDSKHWIEVSAERLGVECEEVRPKLSELRSFLVSRGPAVVMVPGDDAREVRFALIVGRRRKKLLVVGRDGQLHRLDVETLARRLEAPVVSEHEASLDQLLDVVGLTGPARRRAAAALVLEHFGGSEVARAFLLSMPPGRSFLRQLAHAGLLRKVALVLVLHLAAYGAFIAAWYTVGRGALEGTLEVGWLLAWGLLLLTIVPLRMLESWTQEVFAVETGVLLKRRLVAGALRHHPDEIRHMGAGELLGRVLESEAVEVLALSTAFLGISTVIDVAVAGWVLSMGSSGALHGVLLASWIVLGIALALRHHQRVSASTDARLAVSCDLVERLVGHRTRQVQQAPESWHDVEDALLDHHLGTARRFDSSSVAVGAFVPASWLAVSLAAGAPPTLLAVSVGGCLLAQQGLSRLVGGMLNASSLRVAWKKVAPLFRAAAREQPIGVPDVAEAGRESAEGGAPLLEARGVTFRHEGREEPVLLDCTLTIERGDRVLLTGPSGGGKSTLAAIFSGLRAPRSGLVRLLGLDRETWGAEAWRRRIAAAPQSHENYVFAGSLAYNLLLGRGWPASPDDLAEAEEVCRELGLSDLLDRMPAGILQNVGETGWQLSHGERGRLFVARALLQDADVVLFDESFAALDPESLRSAMDCVRERAPALVAIAHP